MAAKKQTEHKQKLQAKQSATHQEPASVEVSVRLGTQKLRRLLGSNSKMKKLLTALTASILFAVGIVALAEQDTTFRQQDVRDPRVLASKLAANAADAETRLDAAGAVATSAIVLTNASNAGTCYIDSSTDKRDNAGDYQRLLFGDGGTFSYQTDVSSAGTLATKFAIDATGIATMLGGATLDNTTSASELNITETAVKVTGNFSATGTAGITGVATFTAESVHNGGIDTDYVTVDAGAGVDCKAAGALQLGIATATSVDIGVAATMTTVKGTLNVDQAVTLDSTLDVSGAARLPVVTTYSHTVGDLTLTSAYLGKLVLCATNGACNITLPTNTTAAGSWVEIAVVGTDDNAPTIAPSQADTLITPNSADSDSVTWGSGHRIGASARFWCDGANWHVQNLGGTTMTYTDSD